MKPYDEKQEIKINALLEGELSKNDADLLKAAALDDQALAVAIIEAHQLQVAMDSVGLERAPSSLTKRLKAVPRQQRTFKLFQPRWVMALATVPIVLLAISLMHPSTPSAEEITRARHDLAIAFSYLDKAGRLTGREIEATVGNTMSDAITGPLIRNIKSQYQPLKETKA